VPPRAHLLPRGEGSSSSRSGRLFREDDSIWREGSCSGGCLDSLIPQDMLWYLGWALRPLHTTEPGFIRARGAHILYVYYVCVRCCRHYSFLSDVHQAGRIPTSKHDIHRIIF
jgi:hypothetical protein